MGINELKRITPSLLIILFLVVLTMFRLNSDTVVQENIKNMDFSDTNQSLYDINDPVKSNFNYAESSDFFGVWSLDKVVLRSNMYSDDIIKNGEIIPFDVEDYLGYELEYSSNSFRLGDDIYLKPEYVLDHISLREFDFEGYFDRTPNFPSALELIEIENIYLDGAQDYDYLDDIPLQSLRVESFEGTEYFKDLPYGQIEIEVEKKPILKKYFNPVGRNCLLLNKNTMLVGSWGKIILAHRVET